MPDNKEIKIRSLRFGLFAVEHFRQRCVLFLGYFFLIARGNQTDNECWAFRRERIQLLSTKKLSFDSTSVLTIF